MTTEARHHLFAPDDHRFDIITDDEADATEITEWASANGVWFDLDAPSGMYFIELRTRDGNLAMLFKLRWVNA